MVAAPSHLPAIIERIESRAGELGLSFAAISRRASGQPDLLRNWQRRVREGHGGGANLSSLESVAQVLGVSAAWLATGAGSPEPAVRAGGLAEDATAYAPQPSTDSAVRALWPDARTPALLRISRALPSFTLAAGDLIVVDLALTPAAGNLITAQRTEPGSQTITTIVRRLHPPYLISGDPGDADPAILADGTLVIPMYPVIGALRTPTLQP